MMNLIVWLITGSLMGWAAGRVMHDKNGFIVNMSVGMLGAMMGGLQFGRPTITQNSLNIDALFISFLSAIIFLGIVNLIRRREVV